MLVEKEERIEIGAFVESAVGDRDKVVREEEGIADQASRAFVAVHKRLDVGEQGDGDDKFFDRVLGVVNARNSFFEG